MKRENGMRVGEPDDGQRCGRKEMEGGTKGRKEGQTKRKTMKGKGNQKKMKGK